MILLDTNVISEPQRQVPNARVLKEFLLTLLASAFAMIIQARQISI